MTLHRPCLVCGEPTRASRCPEHQLKDTPRSHVAYANNARWKSLSKRIRKASPFCEQCGSGDQLQVDHIIPESVAPELAYAEENLRVLCALDNNRRQANYTPDEAQHVLNRLVAAYRRRPTRKGRDRIAAAERALQSLGGDPKPQVRPTAGKAQGAMNLTGVESV